MENEFSSRTHFGLPGNPYGLVDKQDLALGLQEKNLKTDNPELTIRNHIIDFDTRDCFGELSNREAQRSFALQTATAGQIPPSRFKEALNNEGLLVLDKLVEVVYQMQQESLITGFPRRAPDQPYIEGNRVVLQLSNVLKLISNLDIINIIIPRDIIPIYVYFPGFINNCLPLLLPNTAGVRYLNPSSQTPSSIWESPVIETAEDFYDFSVQSVAQNKLSGVFQTPLRYWRSYTGPNCMPNPHTPPPYQLWNPPQDYNSTDPWPFQPQPVRGQRIPSYRARNGVVFSGYGLYDLDDFPVSQEIQLTDGTTIQIPIRKLILKLIVPSGQYINGIAAETLIDNSIVNDFTNLGIVSNPLTETGYGDYQRFLPGPGVAMNYQPNVPRTNKSAPIDLSCSTFDPDNGYLGPMPVPFPNFRGNVWGPYERPGDRFQNTSLQLTVDELYLNGDLDNLEGNSIIYSNFDPTRDSYTYQEYFATLKRPNSIVRFRNFETAANPNLRNAMRVQYTSGFGAVSVYVGLNTTTRGVPGPLEFSGLPNTQYDGQFHKFNSDVWMEAREDIPTNWIETLSGPQKPTITANTTTDFDGWMYIWRDNFPWTGQIYVPVTAGGCGPMEYHDGDSNNPEWKITESTRLTTGSSNWSLNPVIGAAQFIIPLSNSSNFEIAVNIGWGKIITLAMTDPGTGYTVANGVRTISTSTGSGLTIDITSVVVVGPTTVISGFVLRTPGNAYAIGDIITVIQENANNDATFIVTDATAIPENLIPEESSFHYHDPLATGPSAPTTFPGVQQNYINGVDVCTTDCPNTCTPPIGQYTFCIGEAVTNVGTAFNDPRPPPAPSCLPKCDFVHETGPEEEWNELIVNRVPNQRPGIDNVRVRQQNTYLNRRIAYSDSGHNNGFFLSSLINYRSFFVTSTPDTDIVIRIPQALRTSFSQSINPTLDSSNFHVPIRLNLGSTAGTLEYVEAVQGTLTSAGVYWQKSFYPPKAELRTLDLEFFTRDGTPIPLERTLGFIEQFETNAMLFSSSISSTFIFHGSYSAFSPNLPPFPGVFANSPSSVITSSTSNSKTLDNPFDPTLFRYTQRNLAITFRVQVYQPLNPGITNIIKKMPDAYLSQQSETFQDIELTPLASNIDDYGY